MSSYRFFFTCLSFPEDFIENGLKMFPKSLLLITAALLVQTSVGISDQNGYAITASCKCFPSDPCWPSESVWNAFNTTLEGKLIKTVPLASPCHDPTYSAEECEALRNGWLDPETQ